MTRRIVEFICWGLLDDPPEVHDRHAVAHVLHNRQVVRDEEVGEPHRLLELDEQVDDLRLDRHVERRGRLIAYDECGSTARARAMPMRWRWPPENSCG